MTTIEIIRELCKQNGISITVLEQKLGYSNGSISKSSTQYMRSDRLKAIADYFHVSMEYLMGSEDFEFDQETKTWEVNGYYHDDKTAELAEFLHKNPEYSVLFDASRKVKPEDLQKALKAIGIFIDEE